MYEPTRDRVSQVLAEIQCGKGLTFAAAGRLFPGARGGRAVNPSTVFRWATRGLTSPTGVVVRLEAARVGGRWLTSQSAAARFVTALTAAASAPSPDSPAPPSTLTPTARRQASQRAEAALRAAGA